MTQTKPEKPTSYWVVFCNYSTGIEANVHPEETRRDIVKLLRSGDFIGDVVCIHRIEAGRVFDVTRELFAEARQARLEACDEAAEWLEGV